MWYNISIQKAVADESYDFFFKIKDIVTTIEHKSGVSLRKTKKGVTDMINYEERLAERLAEAKESMQRENDERLARKYNWDDELASKMHEHFDNN